jgi:hypothetical protein
VFDINDENGPRRTSFIRRPPLLSKWLELAFRLCKTLKSISIVQNIETTRRDNGQTNRITIIRCPLKISFGTPSIDSKLKKRIPKPILFPLKHVDGLIRRQEPRKIAQGNSNSKRLVVFSVSTS